MDRLWSPWRSTYIKIKKIKGCIFCLKNNENSKRFVVKKTILSFAILNIYPYNNGHIMVSPLRHVRDLKGLTDEELLDIIKLTKDIQRLLENKLRPHGFNIGINTGAVGGAGYKNHLHIHIVPRWQGDTNFMPVIANTKVVPQSLAELRKKLMGK